MGEAGETRAVTNDWTRKCAYYTNRLSNFKMDVFGCGIHWNICETIYCYCAIVLFCILRILIAGSDSLKCFEII